MSKFCEIFNDNTTVKTGTKIKRLTQLVPLKNAKTTTQSSDTKTSGTIESIGIQLQDIDSEMLSLIEKIMAAGLYDLGFEAQHIKHLLNVTKGDVKQIDQYSHLSDGHILKKRKVLRPGTVVAYLGVEAKVVKDAGGNELIVDCDGCRENWLWEFEGDTCQVVN